MPKIIEIRKCLFKLQLKMSGVFFYETQCTSISNLMHDFTEFVGFATDIENAVTKEHVRVGES